MVSYPSVFVEKYKKRSLIFSGKRSHRFRCFAIFNRIHSQIDLHLQNRAKILFLILVISFFASFPVGEAIAQPVLERISVAERADGLGYVIRFHLSEPGIAFESAQPSAGLIQLRLQQPDLTISSPLDIRSYPEWFSVTKEQKEGELRFELSIPTDLIYRFISYMDINRRDLLVALQRIDDEDTEHLTFDAPLFDPLIKMKEESREKVVEEMELEPPLDEPEGTEEAEQLSTTEDGHIHDRTVPRQSPGDPFESSLFLLYPGDPLEEYLRWILDDPIASTGIAIRRSGGSLSLSQGTTYHPWQHHAFFQNRPGGTERLHLLDPHFFLSSNSDYPMGSHTDGALWQGRGINTSFSAGVALRESWFEMVIRPRFVYSANREFDLSPHPPLPGLSEFAMPLTFADLPQRFGDEPVSRLDPGESYLRAFYSGWTAGLSSQRIRTGPARWNPLLFGDHAPGFLHSFVGTDTPFETGIGQLEGRWFWGSLQESGFFYMENLPVDLPDARYITGFTFTFTPELLSGLQLGATRTAVRYYPDEGLSGKDLLLALAPRQIKGDVVDPDFARFIKSSFFIRWYFPRAGLEVYTEWGRNDNRRSFRDFLTEPELNRGYVIGFAKQLYASENHRFLLHGEMVNLENSAMTAQSREFNIWYTHPQIYHGFTQRGQVLGTPIGPGSSSEQVGLSYYNRFGMAGFRLGRIAYNNDRLVQNMDYFKSTLQRPWIPVRRLLEVEMFGALNLLLFLPGGVELQADLRYGVIESRNNRFELTFNPESPRRFIDESNLNVAFTLRYRLSGAPFRTSF